MTYRTALKKFESRYREHYLMLCRVAYRMVGDAAVAGDIVQEVFLKYWQKIHEFPESHQAGPYLYRACIHQSLNYLKEVQRRSEREQTYAAERKVAEESSNRPDRQLTTKETAQKINSAIQALPPACKAAFVLSRHEQKTYQQIAEIMEISVNTVEKHIGKALRILRDTLREE